VGSRTVRRDAKVLFRQRGRVLGIRIEERGTGDAGEVKLKVIGWIGHYDGKTEYGMGRGSGEGEGIGPKA
jgi:hypothetical protein